MAARPLTAADLRRGIQAAAKFFANPDNLRRGIQDAVEVVRGARHPTMVDLMRGIQVDIEAGRGRRFDKLTQPFVFKVPAGPAGRDAVWTALKAAVAHRAAMMRLLRQQFGLPSTGALSERQMNVLLAAALKTYVPAFGKVELVPAKRPPGRPASGLTARQKAAIDKAVEDRRSVRKACLGLARNNVKKAEAMAAAYRRATKPGMRRN